MSALDKAFMKAYAKQVGNPASSAAPSAQSGNEPSVDDAAAMEAIYAAGALYRSPEELVRPRSVVPSPHAHFQTAQQPIAGDQLQAIADLHLQQHADQHGTIEPLPGTIVDDLATENIAAHRVDAPVATPNVVDDAESHLAFPHVAGKTESEAVDQVQVTRSDETVEHAASGDDVSQEVSEPEARLSTAEAVAESNAQASRLQVSDCEVLSRASQDDEHTATQLDDRPAESAEPLPEYLAPTSFAIEPATWDQTAISVIVEDQLDAPEASQAEDHWMVQVEHAIDASSIDVTVPAFEQPAEASIGSQIEPPIAGDEPLAAAVEVAASNESVEDVADEADAQPAVETAPPSEPSEVAPVHDEPTETKNEIAHSEATEQLEPAEPGLSETDSSETIISAQYDADSITTCQTDSAPSSDALAATSVAAVISIAPPEAEIPPEESVEESVVDAADASHAEASLSDTVSEPVAEPDNERADELNDEPDNHCDDEHQSDDEHASAPAEPAGEVKPPVSTVEHTEQTASEATDTQPQPLEPAWEVDRFTWPEVANQLYATEASYFDFAGEKLRLAAEQGLHVLAVTSSQRGEGRTTLAMCLARAAATAGIRVGLMDADTDHPELATALGIDPPCDWRDAVRQEVDFNEVVVRSIEDDLLLLAIPEPQAKKDGDSIRLSDPRVSQLIGRLKDHLDLLVIDMPPVGEPNCEMFEAGEGCPINAAILVRDMRIAVEPQTLKVVKRLYAAGVEAVGLAQNYHPAKKEKDKDSKAAA